MPFIIKSVIAFALFVIGFSTNVLITEPPLGAVDPVTAPYGSYTSFRDMQHDIYLNIPTTTTTTTVPKPVYKHGECDWLPAMALKAGWPVEHLGKLKQIALRESGCCIRRGGEKVDKDCNITGHDGSNHLSDTSILQINGLNFDIKRNPNAPICLQMGICTQQALMDPFTNLKAGKLLYDYWEKAAGDGWIPWDMCNRDKTCK
jgi:hypothetical protein